MDGDLKSREHYAAYAITSLLTGFIGSKGLDKVEQVGKVVAITGLTKGKSLQVNSSAYRNALHILNNCEFKCSKIETTAYILDRCFYDLLIFQPSSVFSSSITITFL